MDQVDPDDRELRLSNEATALLCSDVVQEAFRRVDAQFVGQWRRAATLEERETAHAQMTALTKVRDTLQGMSDERMMRAARAARRKVAR